MPASRRLPSRPLLWLLSCLTAAGLMAGACRSDRHAGADRARPRPDQSRAPAPMPEPDRLSLHDIPIAQAPTMGPSSAPVTVVVISDFKCKHCTVAAKLLREIRQQYPADVRVAFKHYPLGGRPDTADGAMLAECAGEQGRFWEQHDLLFDNQMALVEKGVDAVPRAAGLRAQPLEACLKARPHQGRIMQDKREARAMKVHAVPVFLVNGKYVGGVADPAVLRRVVQEAVTEGRRSARM